MPQILSMEGSQRRKVEKASRQSMFSSLYDWFNSLHKFDRLFILVAILIAVATPSIVGNYQIFNPEAGGKQEPISLATDSGFSGPVSYNSDGTQCYGEDNRHYRTWGGYMTPGQVFTVELPFCELIFDVNGNIIGGGPGGASFRMLSKSPVPLELKAISPKGNVYLPHDLGKVDRKYTLDRCMTGISNPHKFNKYDNEIGVWTVSLTNNTAQTVKDVYLNLEVLQSYPDEQQDKCPREDWNFVPLMITTPINGSAVSGIATVTVKNAYLLPIAGSTGLPYNQVDLYIRSNQSLVRLRSPFFDTPPESFTIQWDTSTFKNGTWSLTADGVSLNYSSDSDPITVNVKN